MSTDEEQTQEEHNLALQSTAGTDLMFDRPRFEQAYKIARLFSQSALVPQHLREKPNDCFIALHMAHRLREDPLMVMQNIVIIHGQAGWKAQWLIARANQSSVFSTRIRYRVEGSGEPIKIQRQVKERGESRTVDATVPDYTVTAYARTADGEEVSYAVSMRDAIAEGWTNNPKYSSLAQLMLSYRAASFLIRLHCPEATLGYSTAEEVEDMAAAGQIKDVTPERDTAEDALRQLGGQGVDPDEQELAGQADPGEERERAAEPPAGPPQDPPAGTHAEPSGGTSGEGAPPQGEAPKSATVTLYGPDDDARGTYQRAGTFLNALHRLLQGYADVDELDKAAAVWHANKPVVERIRSSGKQADKIGELDKLVESLIAADDDWTRQYAETEESLNKGEKTALEVQIREGLAESVARGDVENIRMRIQLANQVSDEGVREELLDELDDALSQAQEAT